MSQCDERHTRYGTRLAPARVTLIEAAKNQPERSTMSESGFTFKLAVTPKPVGGVSVKPVPDDLAKGLAVEVPKVLKSKDHELTITAENEREAHELAAHAKRWGLQQKPELYINKVPNGNMYGKNVARLNVRLMSDVPPENRPGRK